MICVSILSNGGKVALTLVAEPAPKVDIKPLLGHNVRQEVEVALLKEHDVERLLGRQAGAALRERRDEGAEELPGAGGDVAAVPAGWVVSCPILCRPPSPLQSD